MKKTIKVLLIMILGLFVVSCGGGMNKIGEGINKAFHNITNPGDRDIYEWKRQGFKDKAEIYRWRDSGCRDPKAVRTLIDRGLTDELYSKYHIHNKCKFNAWNDYLNEYAKVVINKKNQCKSYVYKEMSPSSAEECFSEYYFSELLNDDSYQKYIKWFSLNGHNKPYMPIQDVRYMMANKGDDFTPEEAKVILDEYGSFENHFIAENKIESKYKYVAVNFKKAKSSKYREIYKFCTGSKNNAGRYDDAYCQCRVSNVYEINQVDKAIGKEFVLLYTGDKRPIKSFMSTKNIVISQVIHNECLDFVSKLK